MATAPATHDAFRSIRTPAVVNVPAELVQRMGAEKVRRYLARLVEDIRDLEETGGQVLSFIDVHRARTEDAVADVCTAQKRKL